jgi:hypothetical protein
MWTIGGSITAFLIGQVVDVAIFHRIRRATRDRWIWLRATGSTAVSQLLDSFVVLYIAFVLGPQQADLALPRRRHGQLPVQDVRRGGADSPDLSDAPAGRGLPRQR